MDIISCLNAAGFEEQAKILEKYKLSTIKIQTEPAEEDDFELGESKIGGAAHLPPDFIWPEFWDCPLIFIAQFNLADIKKYDLDKKLPQEGMLYFFYEGGRESFGDDLNKKGSFFVAHYKGDISKLEVIDMSEYAEFSPCKLNFSSEYVYPYGEHLFSIGLSEEESDTIFFIEGLDRTKAFDEIMDEYHDKMVTCADSQHQLLGYANSVQNEVMLECQLVTNGIPCLDEEIYDSPEAKAFEEGVKDWTLLFQIDSDENADILWGDYGKVYFAIKKDDLAAGNFDNIWGVLQME